MSSITTTYNDSALWEGNSAFDNSRAVGTKFEGMNTGSISSRIALRQLVPVPEGGFTAHVKSGYSTAFTFFDEDKLYLGNTTGGYQPQGVWLSSSERAVTPVDAAKWMCIYLRTNSSATLTPETIETAEFSIEWGGGSMMTKYLNGDGLSHFMAKLKRITGEPEAPYTEVEWVESNGKQFVYLDWKPPVATWGFEADFIIRNAFSTTVGDWNASTNVNGYGSLFGTRNASTVNDCQFTSFGSTGLLRFGSTGYTTAGLFKTDKTRQQVSLLDTSLKRGDGTTVTVTRSSETSGKYYANMTVFAMHEGVRRSATGNLFQPGTCRIYSLKFYESTTVKVDLVGAIRKSDGCTGLYDKVSEHFYPAPGMTYGSEVGDLGEPVDLASGVSSAIPFVYADNPNPTRMWRVSAPTLDSLRDGQQINLTFLYNIGGSVQTTELAGWDDTGNNGSVYLKITLADGTVTDWVPCYCLGTTRLTSHYLGGSTLRLTYRENVTPNSSQTSTTAIMRGWFCDPYYNTDQQYDRFTDTCIAGKNGIKRYTLCMKDDESNWTSITTTANSASATGKVAYSGGLRLGKVLYAITGADYAAGASSGVLTQTYQGVDFRYSVNGITNTATTELQLRKPVYLVGTLGSDGLFYLDSTKWWTQTLPTTEDGKVYVHVGTAYSSYYAIFLAAANRTYKYQDGRIVEVFAGDASTVDGHTVQSDVPANAKFTDTTYSAGTGLSLSGTTFSNAGATGVKGNAETAYRTGQVNLTAANVGAVAKAGDTMTGMLVAPKIRAGRVVYGVSRYLFDATAKETIIYTGIKFVTSSHMPVVHMSGFAYGAGRTTELHVAMYIFQNEFYGTSTITNLGAWNPTAYLFTYVKDSTTYVAIGLSGDIYYNMMNVDVQDERGNFANVDVDGWVITPYTDTGHIPAVGTDHCRKLDYGIDVLKPPVGAATGTLPIANGGTGKTTAAEAWTALGGGAIGKKASLAASDIPAHASTATTYGAASTTNYGHAKLSSATNSSVENLAATPKAVKAAYDLASGASTQAGQALSAATGAYAFKVTYAISGGTVTCYPHVYSAGSEVTSTFAASCFAWYYEAGAGNWVSLGSSDSTTDRKKTVALSTLGYGGNVKCDFTPPSS